MYKKHSFSKDFIEGVISTITQGLLILDSRGSIIYANTRAGELFDMPVDGLLECEKEDLLSLCQEGRLEHEQLTFVLDDFLLDEEPVHTYEIATSEKRLLLTPYFVKENGRFFTIILVEPNSSWRDDLVTQILMEEMTSPISMASSYSHILKSRLKEGSIDGAELLHLVSIIANSLDHSLELWEDLGKLKNTDPAEEPFWEMFPTNLIAVIINVVNEINEQASVKITADLPMDFPEIAGNLDFLRTAFKSMLTEIATRVSTTAQIVIRAEHEETYCQVFFYIKDVKQQPVHPYLFDELPFALAEQVIKRHEGRIWLNENSSDIATVSITLPLWQR